MNSVKTPLAAWLDAQPENRSAFAREWEISEGFLSQIANGSRTPKPALAERIEGRTGIDARELLGIPKRKTEKREGAPCQH